MIALRMETIPICAVESRPGAKDTHCHEALDRSIWKDLSMSAKNSAWNQKQGGRKRKRIISIKV
jgi:hypothetical protein